MKKIKWLFVATLSAGLLITSCGKEKEEETPTEKESTLKPEEHKSNIESEGIAFVKNIRITSYNVCYTKLLRVLDAAKLFSHQSYLPEASPWQFEPWQLQCVYVITSYSIHYTKLYENMSGKPRFLMLRIFGQELEDV